MEYTEFENVVLKKDIDYGGIGSLLTGKPGCGKTNVMARMALTDIKKNIKVIWRAKDTCQWSVFLGVHAKLVFWMKRGVSYKIINREKSREETLSMYGKINRWEHPEEIIEGIEKGVINVVMTIPSNEEREEQHKMFVEDWNLILKAATKKRYPDPISIYFDEVEDLAPESKPGFYKKSLAIAGKQKELRKNKIHFTGATHRTTEIFWVMRNKLPWKIYMHGATPLKHSNVFQKSIDKLEPGYAFIEDRSFQKVYFKFVGKPKDIFMEMELAKNIEKEIEKKEKETWNRERESLFMFAERLRKDGFSDKEIAKRADVSRQRIQEILNEEKISDDNL